MAEESQINLFDNESDTAMYKHKLTLEKIRNELINFGLTKSQAKVLSILVNTVQKLHLKLPKLCSYLELKHITW